MGLREQAEKDLSFILEDEDGFGWPVRVTDPNGLEKPFIGQSNDISLMINPETGLPVSGRTASVSLRISSIANAGMMIPYGVSDNSKKPFLVNFDSINGVNCTFKVKSTMPDLTLGIVVCILEFWK